jgi:hypothetical protein
MKLNFSSLTSRVRSREHIPLNGEVAKAECEYRSLPSEQFPQYSARNGTAICAGDPRQEAKKRFVDLCAVRFFGHDNISDKLSQRNEGGHGQRPSPRPLGRKDSEQHGCPKHEERSKQQIAKFQVEKSGAQSEYDAKNVDEDLVLVHPACRSFFVPPGQEMVIRNVLSFNASTSWCIP